MPRQPKLFVIDDCTKSDVVKPGDRARGLRPELRDSRGYSGVAEPFPKELYIPRSEWQARIQEQEERRTSLYHLMRDAKWQVKDQGAIPFCWIYSPVTAMEMLRIGQGQRQVKLSPESAGGPIKNFRKVGGWGREALEWLILNGCCTEALWPPHQVSRSLWTDAAKAEALKYRVDEWWVLPDRDHDALISCLLRNIPVSAGYNWWGHQVTPLRAVWLDGQAWPMIANSWGRQWGDDGYGVLQGNRAIPDDAVAPRSVTPA